MSSFTNYSRQCLRSNVSISLNDNVGTSSRLVIVWGLTNSICCDDTMFYDDDDELIDVELSSETTPIRRFIIR